MEELRDEVRQLKESLQAALGALEALSAAKTVPAAVVTSEHKGGAPVAPRPISPGLNLSA